MSNVNHHQHHFLSMIRLRSVETRK